MEKIYTKNKVLSGTISGSDGITQFMEGCETGLFDEARRCPEEGDQKLQSNSTDICDVQVVCIMYLVASGEGKKSPKSGRICILVGWMG